MNNDLLLVIIVALLGGLVTYLYSYTQTDVFSFPKCLVQMIISGFCGSLLGHLVLLSHPDYSYFTAGIGGVFGIHLFQAVVNIGIRIFGKQANIDVSDLGLRMEGDKKEKKDGRK